MVSAKLSIALVTRNRPQWLERSLASWNAQSIQPFEIIVSDDSEHSSHSENQEIAQRYGARWVIGPHRGLYANRNHAFRQAAGTHIMSADDDHTHPPGFVAVVFNAIESDPEAIWTVTERSPAHPDAPLPEPGEIRSNGTIGPPEDPDHSAAIACGSTSYPRNVFDSALYYDETYPFGGMWYLWGHQLRKAGFRIRYCPKTFVWHHTESSRSRQNDIEWLKSQLECNLYVQASHAFHFSRSPSAAVRLFVNSARLVTRGETVINNTCKVRLGIDQIACAFVRAAKHSSSVERGKR
jgi:GT2 family glycosyltransferase